MEEMDKSVVLLFLYIDCGQATATRAPSGCPRRAVFSGEKEICHCFLSQLHSSLIEHKHLFWSLPIPEPIWDVGARNIPSSWEIALASAAHLHLIDSGRRIRSVCGDRRPYPSFFFPGRGRSSDRHREKSEI